MAARADLPQRYAVCPAWMIGDPRINAAALRLWLYLYDCGFRREPPRPDDMRRIAGRRPYSKDGIAQWKQSSERHMLDLLTELEQAGYITWQRKGPVHERFTVLYGQPHVHADQPHVHADQPHVHADQPHAHADPPYIEESKNQDHDDDEGGAQNFRFNDQGAELLELGFSRKVALEFQMLPAHQFRAIAARAREVGRKHNGATVAWARARLREGWPEQERSNNNHGKDTGWGDWEDTSVPESLR